MKPFQNIKLRRFEVAVVEDKRVLLGLTSHFSCIGGFGMMKESLRRIDRNDVEPVLTDIGLPRMDSFEGT